MVCHSGSTGMPAAAEHRLKIIKLKVMFIDCREHITFWQVLQWHAWISHWGRPIIDPGGGLQSEGWFRVSPTIAEHLTDTGYTAMIPRTRASER